MQEGTLHSWFGKSKSKDGKPGWVQSDGSPCANEKGETKTPKCYSSRRLAGLKKTKEGKAKIRSADARKSRQDPGQQGKSGAAKPTMVRTFKDKKDYKKHPSGDYHKHEEFEMQFDEAAKDKKGSGSGTKDACYHKVKARYDVWPSAYASGALVKCRKKGAANWGNKTRKEEWDSLPEFTQAQIDTLRKRGVEVEVVTEACWKGYEKKGMKTMFGKKYPNCVKKTTKEEVAEKIRADREKIEEGFPKVKGTLNPWEDPKTGKSKVKLVTDPKTGKPKEITEVTYPSDFIDKKTGKTKSVASSRGGGRDRRNWRPQQDDQKRDRYGRRITVDEEVSLDEARLAPQNGAVYAVMFVWRGKYKFMKLFFPELKRPTKQQVTDAIQKIYPGAIVNRYDETVVQQGDSYLNVGQPSEYAEFGESTNLDSEEYNDMVSRRQMVDKRKKRNSVKHKMQTNMEEVEVEEAAAWTKKSGKNPSGGLNEKGRKSYERENPGSDLKAPSKKVGNPRRKSFCARMKGMKKKLTSSKTANDPDSRINKSLRAWNC